MESDLFGPIKTYFEAYGYECDGEVQDIDLYMEKEGKSVAVELKQTFDFKALQQAALRQKIADTVFIGIFKPRDLYSRSFQDKVYLLKRLGIGLIVVSKSTNQVEIVNEPVVKDLASFRARNAKKKKALSKEFQRRKTKNNVGGVHAKKLITSYREEALLVLDACVELGGEATTKDIRIVSNIPKTTSILYHNYYGWFENIRKGIYKVTEKGYFALEEFEDTIYLLKKGMNVSGNISDSDNHKEDNAKKTVDGES